MPVVYLRYNPEKITRDQVDSLAKGLTSSISEALDVPESQFARLGPTDIEITPVELTKRDTYVKDLEVLIFAHAYPERLQNLDERNEKITRRLKAHLSALNLSVSGWVWTHLNPTAFNKL